VLFRSNFPSIEAKDQEALGKLRVGIAGLSVGRDVALALMMTGIRHLSIADFDTIAPSNLNRMGAVSLFEIGENKTESLTRVLYEFSPFLDLHIYPEGLNHSNIDSFVLGNDVLVDAMDAFPLKAKMRILAQLFKKIVVMGTDTAMRPIREIEVPEYPAFGGRVDKATIDTLIKGPKNKKEARKLLGIKKKEEADNFPEDKTTNSFNRIVNFGDFNMVSEGSISEIIEEVENISGKFEKCRKNKPISGE